MLQLYVSLHEDGLYTVFGYDGRIHILFQSKSEEDCDDFADNYAINNNMYYSRSDNTYYLK